MAGLVHRGHDAGQLGCQSLRRYAQRLPGCLIQWRDHFKVVARQPQRMGDGIGGAIAQRHGARGGHRVDVGQRGTGDLANGRGACTCAHRDGVHGVGGILGALLTGVLASPLIQSSYSGAIYGNFHQLWIQFLAVGVTIIFSGVGTFILFKLVDKLVGLRASDKHEAIGLDETQHGETAYNNFD